MCSVPAKASALDRAISWHHAQNGALGITPLAASLVPVPAAAQFPSRALVPPRMSRGHVLAPMNHHQSSSCSESSYIHVYIMYNYIVYIHLHNHAYNMPLTLTQLQLFTIAASSNIVKWLRNQALLQFLEFRHRPHSRDIHSCTFISMRTHLTTCFHGVSMQVQFSYSKRVLSLIPLTSVDIS